MRTSEAASVFALFSLMSCAGGGHPPPATDRTGIPSVRPAARSAQPTSATPAPAPAAPGPAAPFVLPTHLPAMSGALRGRQALEALRPLRSCTALDERLPDAVSDGVSEATVLAAGDFIELWTAEHGNGVGHEEYAGYLIARVADCTALSLELGFAFESWTTSAWFEPIGVTPPDAASRLWLVNREQALFPPREPTGRFAPDDPRSGPGRLKITGSRGGPDEHQPDAWEVGIVGPEQPELQGAPTAGPGLYFEVSELRAAGFGPVAEEAEGRRAPDAFTVASTDAPVRRLAAGDRAVYDAPLRVRQRGALVAVHDRARDRHRWACLIRVGVPRWLGVRDDLALASAQTEHPVFAQDEAVWAVDLRRGRCHAIQTPLPFADESGSEHRYSSVRLDRDALVLESGDASLRIPIADLRRRIDAAGP